MKSDGKWWDQTWNPVTGCTPVSAGCANCWAKRMHDRHLWDGDLEPGRDGARKPFSTSTLHHDRLEQPLRWRKPRRVAVCLMGDLFHEDVQEKWIDAIFMVMAMTLQHTYVILTKRPKLMAAYCSAKPWFGKTVTHADGKRTFTNSYSILPNVWVGTSVEDQATADERLPHLRKCPAAKRFISCEPLLSEVALHLCPAPDDVLACDRDPDNELEDSPCACKECWSGRHWVNAMRHGEHLICPDWVIVGSESGPGARPMDLDWVRSIVNQCRDADVPLFFKQQIVNGKRVNMPELDGVVYDKMPEATALPRPG